MLAATHAVPVSKKTLWVGVVVSALPVLFLIFDAVIKVILLGAVVDSFAELGYPASLALGIGIVELACIAVYLIPRTSILGAIVLTGYLGGAFASHVRVGSPVFSVVFPVIMGALIWGGLFLRDDRLRALVPLRSEPAQ